MSQPQLMPVGIAGHGMLLSPVPPCRFAQEPDGTVWIRSSGAGMVGVTPGAHPAAGELARVDGAPDPSWRFGDAGPVFKMLIGSALDEVLRQIDAGLGEFPWSILGPGFWIDLPIGFVGYSPTNPDDPFPELHLREADFRGPRTIRDAFIQFEARPIAASAIRLTGPYEAEESVLETELGPLRFWEYQYEAEGVTWSKRHYALPLDDASTLMMYAQSPAPHAERMFEGADFVASTFSPASL